MVNARHRDALHRSPQLGEPTFECPCERASGPLWPYLDGRNRRMPPGGLGFSSL